MIKSIIAGVLSVGLMLGIMADLRAAEQPAGAAAAAKKQDKAKYRPFRGTIKAMDKAAKTITLEGEKAQQFVVNADTQIKKEGKAAALDNLAVGDRLGGRARENAAGQWEALTINVGAPVAKAVAPGKAEKPKKKE